MMFSFSEGPAIMRGEGLKHFKNLLLVRLWIANAKEIIQTQYVQTFITFSYHDHTDYQGHYSIYPTLDIVFKVFKYSSGTFVIIKGFQALENH
jgi:hypothetical protein